MRFADVVHKAINSVMRRGFHRAKASEFVYHDTLLTAQVVRLSEEVGEVNRTLRKGDGPGMLSELADVFIVCCQIAYRLDVDGEQFQQAITDKLAADDKRGWLHRGGSVPLVDDSHPIQELYSKTVDEYGQQLGTE